MTADVPALGEGANPSTRFKICVCVDHCHDSLRDVGVGNQAPD